MSGVGCMALVTSLLSKVGGGSLSVKNGWTTQKFYAVISGLKKIACSQLEFGEQLIVGVSIKCSRLSSGLERSVETSAKLFSKLKLITYNLLHLCVGAN